MVISFIYLILICSLFWPVGTVHNKIIRLTRCVTLDSLYRMLKLYAFAPENGYIGRLFYCIVYMIRIFYIQPTSLFIVNLMV